MNRSCNLFWAWLTPNGDVLCNTVRTTDVASNSALEAYHSLKPRECEQWGFKLVQVELVPVPGSGLLRRALDELASLDGDAELLHELDCWLVPPQAAEPQA